MSHGFTATNSSGQVLVSTDTKNLHFYGKASFLRTLAAGTKYGGMYRWVFGANCIDYPTPFFTANGGFIGLISIKLVGSVWEIDIVSSVASPPEIYVFTPARSIQSSERYGMVVYKDATTVAFDSRLKPLSVYGGQSITPPTAPRAGAVTGLDSWHCRSMSTDLTTLAPDNWNTSYINMNSSNPKPIYYYPSTAQSQIEQEFTTGRWGEGGYFDKREYQLWSWYWCFYREAIRATAQNANQLKVDCGWCPVEGNCHEQRYESGKTVAGISFGGGGVSSGGKWPYSNKTLNITSKFLMVSNGDLYD